jgi:hypothetical protein
MYPNPAQTEITIHSDNLSNGKVSVRIYTIAGVPVKEYNYNVENKKLDALIQLYGLAHGTYVVELITVKERRANSLIIQ